MKLALCTIFILLLAGCSASSEDTDSDDMADTPKTGLSIVVVSQTIQPVRDATVVVQPGNLSKEADLFGRVRFIDLEPGSYQVSASAEGFADDTATIQVVQGDMVSARLMLQQEVEPIPRFVTHDFPGFFSAGAGPAHDSASGPMQEAGVYECVCDFQLHVPKRAVAFVVQAYWEDNVEPPQEPQYRWSMTWDNVTVSGKGASPMRSEVQVEEFGENFTLEDRVVQISLRPDEVWPTSDQTFTLYVTTFELVGPPEGWSFSP